MILCGYNSDDLYHPHYETVMVVTMKSQGRLQISELVNTYMTLYIPQLFNVACQEELKNWDWEWV